MMGFYRFSNGWLTLRGGSNRSNWRLKCCGQSSRDYDVMTLALGGRQGRKIGSAPLDGTPTIRGKEAVVPIRAAAVHNQILTSSIDGGKFSDPEQGVQAEMWDAAKIRLDRLNEARNAASSLFVEALGYPVVGLGEDQRVTLRYARSSAQVLPACLAALLELSELLPL
jgi:hypothetical protein